jgi:predicted KAP-like P-loop ATPase
MQVQSEEESGRTNAQRDFAVEPYEPAEDKLGRKKFTRHVANYITNWDKDESLVVAVYGGWGEGKTFLKDRVLEEIYGEEKLRDSDETIPVVQYNPWRWSGQNELYGSFFQTLEERFRDLGKKEGKSAPEWESLADDANAAAASRGFAFGATRDLGTILGVILAVATFFGIPQLPDTFTGVPFLFPRGWVSDEIIKYLVLDTPWSLVAVKWWLGFLALVAFVVWFWKFGKYRYFLAKANQEQRSLGEVRGSIQKTLRKLHEKGESVLIVIDDIDRLTADQIRMMMQLVKANANFVGVKYLLLFERQVVEESLHDPENGIDGSDFLQKIVRRGFDLPAIPTSRLVNHFDERLQEELGQELAGRVRGILSGIVFRRLLNDHLLHYLNTIRDVDRLLGTLPLHLKLYDSGGDRLDVYIPDLVCIEVLRIFEPDLFREIQKFRSELTIATSYFPDHSGNDKARLKDVQKSLLETVAQEDKPTVKGLLHELFPLLEWAERETEGAPWSKPVQEWLAQNRITHRRNFDRYFERALREGDVSQGMVDDLLYPDDVSVIELAETWRQLIARDRGSGVEDALYKLLDRTNEVSDPETFLEALFEVADDFPSKSQDSLTPSPHVLAADIVRRVLKQTTDDRVTREELLNSVIGSTNSPCFSCRVIEEIAEVEGRRRDDSEAPVKYSKSAIQEGKKRCIIKIKEFGDKNLLDNDNLMYLLIRWYRWVDEQEPKDWLREVMNRDDENVFRVLRGFRRGSEPAERGAIHAQHDVPLGHAIAVEWLDEFDVLDSVHDLLDDLDEEEVDDNEKELTKMFNIALEIYRGKTDDIQVKESQVEEDQNDNDEIQNEDRESEADNNRNSNQNGGDETS